MELIYLWVEDYKNIKNQGFNFSSRFRCNYNQDNNELTIEENKDYFHIFPENINVTAIVGKNGSGKSTLIESIVGGIFLNCNKFRSKFDTREFKSAIFIYNVIGKLIIYSYNHDNLSVISNKIKHSTENLYYEDSNKKYINQDLLKNYHLLFDFSMGTIDIWNYDSNKTDYEYKQFYALEPSRGYLSTGGAGMTSKIEPNSFDANLKANIFNLYVILKNNEKFHKLFKQLKLPVFTYITITKMRRTGKKLKINTIEELKNIKLFNLDFNNINASNMENKLNEELDKQTGSKHLIRNLQLEDASDIEILSIYYDLSFENDDGNTFQKLSTGQKLIISYLGIISNRIEKIKTKCNSALTICIDEIETSLHPDWQRNFINILITFLELDKFKNISYQIIIATHSPFIISDLVKNNIIFLSNNQQNNNALHLDTFGANIHTLLSDAFFMEDGLIGEFAKEKINKAITYLNQKSLSEAEIKYCENIIRIIGEPIIKRQLQKMLDSKRLTKLDTIDARIADLKYELEILERHQNKIVKDNLVSRSKRKYHNRKQK